MRTGSPTSASTPTTKPSSASKSSRADGPKTGLSAPAGRCCPYGRRTGVPDTITVPARPWYPIGWCRQFGLRPEPGRKIWLDVAGVVLRGVEIDVVGDGERQPHRGLRGRHQQVLERLAVLVLGSARS